MATATSTTNLLQAVNRVLEALGERRVSSLTSPIAVLASNILKDVCFELSTVHDWSWARDRIPATSWTLQRALLTNITKVWGVYTGDSTITGYQPATFIERDVFNRLTLQGYNSTNYPYGGPTWWTIHSYTEVDVNPYPTDFTSQARVLFDVTRLLVPPNVATGFFPIPEQFMSVLIYRASAIMAIEHLNDETTAAQMMNLFETYAQRARQTDGLHPARGLTLRRKGRG